MAISKKVTFEGNKYYLGNTPLNESLLYMNKMIPMFKKKYDIEKLREYEEHFKISNPKDKYDKVIEVKNNFNKILTTV